MTMNDNDNRVVLALDEAIKSLESMTPSYKRVPQKVVDLNVKRFTKPMQNIEKELNVINTAATDISSFQERLGVYIKANPITNSTNLPELVKALQGIVDVYDTSVGKLPKGGLQTLAREAVHEQSLLHMTRLGEDVQSQIRNILEQGVNTDLSRREIINNMMDELGKMTRTRAEVIARTETNNAYNQGRYEQAKALDKQYFIVVSTPTCCEKCYAEYNGKVFHAPEDEDKIPPLHPNCYCEAVFFTREEVAEEAAADSNQDLTFD